MIEELISSAERGVEVELTRDGRVVARVVAVAAPDTKSDLRVALDRLHAQLPADLPRTGWSEALRAARDESPV